MTRLLSFIAGALLGAATALAPHVVAQRPPVPAPYPTPMTQRPAWLDQPTHVLDVRWIRSHGATSDTRDGTCTLFMADTREQDLSAAEEQALACVRAGQFAAGPRRPGLLRLHWHVVDTREQAAQRMASLYVGLPPRPLWGFHLVLGDVCHVVTARGLPALGHEIKHCLDGDYHSKAGQWITNHNRRSTP